MTRIFLIFLALLSYSVQSQYTVLDSLKTQLQNSRNTSDSLFIINKLAGKYNTSTYINDDSIRHYSNIGMDLARRSDNDSMKYFMVAYYALSHYYSDTSKYFSYFDKAEKIAVDHQLYDKALVAVLNQVIRYENFSQYDRMESKIRDGLKYQEKSKEEEKDNARFHQTSSRLFTKMANCMLAGGRVEDALSWTYRLQDYASEHHIISGKVEAYLTFIKIYKTILDNTYISQSFSDKQRIDSLLKSSIDSLHYYTESRATRFLIGRYITCTYEYGQYYLRNREYENAKLFFEKSLALSIEKKRNYYTSLNFDGLFDICMLSDTIHRCYPYLERMEKVSNVMKTDRWDLLLYRKRLEYFTAVKNKTQADIEYRKLSSLLERYASDTELIPAYESLVKYAESRGYVDDAYRYYRSSRALQDSIKADKLSRQFEDLRIKYDVANTKAENAELKEQQTKTKLQYTWALSSFIILFLLASGSFVFYYLRNRNTKLENERKVENFKQRMLRSQMSPHFTFNVLGTIQGYIVQNKMKKADQYLAAFAKLIRRNIDFANRSSITLDQEVSFIKDYLQLEMVRKEDLFRYDVHIDDHNALSRSIQPLFVQPLVENAIKHGFKNIDEGGIIEVSYVTKDTGVAVTIEDNGCGFQNSTGSSHKSLGLGLIRERMEILNKKTPGYTLNIHSSDQGTKISIYLPYVS